MVAFDFTKAYFETLLETERLPEAELKRYQADLLAQLLQYAVTNVPFYRDWRMPDAPIDVSSPAWLQMPTIDRHTLGIHANKLKVHRLPRGHGQFRHVSSSGSTGLPVEISLSQLDAIARVSPTYRLFSVYEMDPSRPLFMIRNKKYSANWTNELVFRKWAYPWLPEQQLGDRVHLDIEMPAVEQLDQLLDRSPAYVNTLPWNILRLGLEARRSGRSPSIPILIAVAEYLPPEVTALAEQVFGSRVINILASSEAGPIAIQCPASHRLHIQSEVVLAEILDDQGRPCQPGQTGELVLTPLYNYAMPLIRYRSGDFVVQGDKCSCGRSLPTIERFVGRAQHRFCFLDGALGLPAINRVRISQLMGHEAWQLVQIGSGKAELRYEPSPSIDVAADAIHAHVLQAVGEGWSLDLTEVDEVPKTVGGKRHYCINATA